MRKDNLEYRTCSYLGNPPEHIGWEICKWEPNNYYGRESDFIKDGDYYHPNSKNYNFVHVIHKDCFKHPESSYTIASWHWDDHEGCYDLEFCGNRPMLLSDKEWQTFRELLDYGFRQLNPSWYEE